MQTMHQVLPVGAFDWEGNHLSKEVFNRRISKLNEIMVQRDLSGLIIFGDISSNGFLHYFTSFTPRLGAAFALITSQGVPRILTLEGTRMVPAGKLTTWISDVRAANNIRVSLNDWIKEFPDIRRLGIVGFDYMSEGLYNQICELPEIDSADDISEAVAKVLRCKTSEEIEILAENCKMFSSVENLILVNHEKKFSITANVLTAEKEARTLDAQDVRCLYSVDKGATFEPYQGSANDIFGPAIFYLAIRRFGYWVDGFITTDSNQLEDRIAKEVLDNLIQFSIANKSARSIIEYRDQLLGDRECHPLLSDTAGAGIGVFLEETPYLDIHSDEVLEVDDVLSFKVGLVDINGEIDFASAIVRIGHLSNSILWKSN